MERPWEKAVTVGSNMHKPPDTTAVDRRNTKGEREKVRCPKAIADYNVHMTAVDKFDQRMSFYNIVQKFRRWRVKLFYYLIEYALVNSYI